MRALSCFNDDEEAERQGSAGLLAVTESEANEEELMQLRWWKIRRLFRCKPYASDAQQHSKN